MAQSMMRVWPTSENVRTVIKHPTGVRFNAGDGSGLWPADAFTFRRIADGDVTDEAPAAAKPAAPAKTTSPPPAKDA